MAKIFVAVVAIALCQVLWARGDVAGKSFQNTYICSARSAMSVLRSKAVLWGILMFLPRQETKLVRLRTWRWWRLCSEKSCRGFARFGSRAMSPRAQHKRNLLVVYQEKLSTHKHSLCVLTNEYLWSVDARYGPEEAAELGSGEVLLQKLKGTELWWFSTEWIG